MDASFFSPPNFPTEGWDVFRTFVIVGAVSLCLLPSLAVFALAIGMRKLAAMIVLVLAIVWAATAFAHEDMDPALRQWFEGLQNQKGVNCCSNADGFDAEWDTLGDKFRVKLKGEWHVVPDDALVTSPNLVGVAKVWWYIEDGKTGVRCFMPGTMG